jgi:putative membrane protein
MGACPASDRSGRWRAGRYGAGVEVGEDGRDSGRPPSRWVGRLRAWWRGPKDIGLVDQEPDIRFSLANERTFLAWIRTSLALLAGGVAVVQVVPDFSVSGARHILGVPLILLSIAVAATSYRRWATTERAIRQRRPLPVSGLTRLLAAGVGAVSVVALIFVLFASRGTR